MPDDDDRMPLAYGLTDPIDLAINRLPHALDRFRIAHLSDLHLRKRTKRLDRLINQLAKLRLDLGVLTGDYMLRNNSLADTQALPYLRDLTSAVRPKLGWYGVFGNHDSPSLRRSLTALPIHWLVDQGSQVPGLPLHVWGADTRYVSRSTDAVILAASLADDLGRAD